jgi:excisionase family DNA binding protein
MEYNITMMTPLGEWLTVKEAAEVGGYHPDHIRRLLRAGLIQAQKWGNTWMVNKPSLLEYQEHTREQGEKRGPK